jgi:phytoene dehydrogenase-like protein
MCGSATHPGGGIMGANGRIASQVILKEWKGGSTRTNATVLKAAN